MIRKVMRGFGKFLTAGIIIAAGVGLAWSMQIGAKQLPLRQYFSKSYSNAIWDWSNILNKTPQGLKEQADFLYMHQLNAVYVDVSSYANIADEKDISQRASDQAALDKALANYVAAMARQNIKVYAAAGDVSWSNPDQRYKPVSIVSAVVAYNRNHPDTQVAGIEFDIESYNQSNFTTSSVTAQTITLTDYLDTVDLLASKVAGIRTANGQLELGFAIPYWYDNENGNIPSVTWRGKTGPMLYHILDRLNSLSGSNIVVMAYRNAASGNDGSIAHTRTEIEYAQAKAPRVGVLLGQEVNQTDPAKITFYGESKTDLSSQIGVFEDEFKQDQAFKGVAINDLAGYQVLTDE